MSEIVSGGQYQFGLSRLLNLEFLFLLWSKSMHFLSCNETVLNIWLRTSKTLYGPDHSVSKWHAGLSVGSFPGETVGQKIANAAHSIGAHILSPAAVSSNGTGIDPDQPTYVPFTTREMILEAHMNGILVKPWTVSSRLYQDRVIPRI
jgi:hypothetical protein